MTTIEKEFFRTQREAGIQFAPWAENVELQRAAGWFLGVFSVGLGAAVVVMLCAGLLKLLAGGA